MEISKARLSRAKRAYVTRRAIFETGTLLVKDKPPASGDLCLARVKRLGHHRKLELISGRRSTLYVGDEVIVAFADRYATDQFAATVPESLEQCHLVAAGGIASKMISKHSKTRLPTRIQPLGLLCDAAGEVLNVRRWAISEIPVDQVPRPHLIAVFGCGMNAGKTTAVSNIVRALKTNMLKAAATKITGTGSGGDMWQYIDAGASAVFDFTDAGYASTVGLNEKSLNEILLSLYSVASSDADVVVAEIADGVYQPETAAILRSEVFRELVDTVIFAASDPMSAMAGVTHLNSLGYDVAAVSGAISASELAVKELESVADFEVLPTVRFEKDDRIVSIILRGTATRPERYA